MTDQRHDRVRDFLTELERREARLLAWGVVDGGFTRPEVEDLARSFLEEEDAQETPEELFREIQKRRLLFPFRAGAEPVYRTRMAETIRLLARLRQLFPNRPWRIAPTLVSDYRFAVRPRTYPRRTLPAGAFVSELESEVQLSGVQRQAMEALLETDDGEMQLAEFQARATRRMLQDLAQRTSRGMIVGAGTGTGKTLAFYLPALSYLAALVRSSSNWTKAVAIYPRNELLKDQFQDAFRQARKLDELLRGTVKRKLLIGAYFGPTPATSQEGHFGAQWAKRGTSYVCPYLSCVECGGELHWRAEDRKAERERLRCADCGYSVKEDEIVLTRNRMAKTPPDLLFTTTETLNRRLSDSASRHVFGVGAHQPPRILLLDEAHTYAGVHGAQVAYLVRRWRKALRAPLHVCGLSATLEDAGEFFSTLIGLPTSSVEVILPHDEDMIEEGVEYQLALRGDPASGASLLSTTIQTVMLLRRALDSRIERRSGGLYGNRVFVFTDDLDVTNRLYHDLQDVEGRTSWGTQKRGGVVLASLRAHAADDAVERLRAGQSWLMAEEIHAPVGLGEPLVIGRTSSQDAGVDPDADVIVATASLEVGFNDPEVGAVVQHKAPMDSASFLQRKGRAGRDRRMRPWTVVVLSDYGRDRIAYQAYDQLFDPVLRARSLPVGNRHVLRMQAVYAFMDWVAAQLPSSHAWGNVWRDFAAPPHRGSRWMAARQAAEIDLLRELLAGNSAREASLHSHLVAALQIPDDEALAVMWEPPRALLTSVLPTLLRRLETGWRRLPVAAESDHEPHQASAPLPEFVPENLFSDLNLPEVTITTPAEFRNDAERTWTMGILQAMRTFAPGRASRRFGVRSGRATHWVAPPGWGGAGRPTKGDQPAFLPIAAASSETEYLGDVQVEREGTIQDLPSYRAWAIEPEDVPANVLPSSNAFLVWRTQLGPTAEGRSLMLPEHGAWRGILLGATAYTHNQRAHVRVRRFALGSEVSVRTRRGDSQEFTIHFVDSETGGRPAALGFGLEVDGIVFRVAVPESIRHLRADSNSEKMRALRTAFFRHRVVQEPKLGKLANVFQREWLQQIYLSALVSGALESGTSLPEANQVLAGEGLRTRMERVLDIIFQSVATETEAAREEEETPGSERQKVHEALRHLTSNPEVVEILADHARVLWEEPDGAWDAWIAGRFKATLGGALLEAAYRMCPQIEEGDLLLDLDPGPRAPDTLPREPGAEEIWLTESVLGGAGHIEALLREYVTDPRRFFHLVERALAPSDLEMVDVELTRTLDLLEGDAPLRESVEEIRRARTHAQLQRSTRELKRRLAEHGVLATHVVLNSLYTRLLRPGSSSASDDLVRSLVRRWRAHEADLGVEIDARIFAYLASGDEALDASLGHIDPAFRKEAQWRFQVLYGLLWPRGNVIRSRTLKAYNPFANLPDPERELLLDVLEAGEEVVSLSDPEWREAVTRLLMRTGTARVKAQLDEATRVRQAIAHLAAIPLEIGFLHLYPQVQGVRRAGDGITVDLYLREAIQ
jgi:hypothetical protein